MERVNPRRIRGIKVALLSGAVGICVVSAGWVLAQSNLMELGGDLSVSGDATIGSDLELGEEDTVQGHIDLYGDATTGGGMIPIHNSGNEDDAVPFYRLTADGTNLQLYGFSSSDLTLNLSNSGGGQAGIRMNGGLRIEGDAAIGTAAPPSARLEVRSSGLGADVANLCDSDGNKLMQLLEGGGGNAVLNLFESDGTTRFVHLQPGADSYYAGTGQFGIGTSATEYKLHVFTDDNKLAKLQSSSSSCYLWLEEDSDINSISIDNTGKLYLGGNSGNAHEVILRTGWTPRVWVATNGNVGIGINSPGEKLDVNGAVRLRDVSSASGGNGFSVLFSKDDSGTSRLYGGDESTTATLLSSHKDPREVNPQAATSFADASIALPFSFHHYNQLIGKGAVVDMAALVAKVEQLTGNNFTYGYDLPEEEVLNYADWQQGQVARMEVEAQKRILEQEPEVEMNITEAWELVEVKVAVDTIHSVTRYTYDLDAEQVTLETLEEPAVEWVGTGVYERRLKSGVRFDETTGRFYRERTLEEIEIEPIPPPELPEWVVMRLP